MIFETYLFRYGKEWNPSDAIRIMEYCVKKNYGANIDWELGNGERKKLKFLKYSFQFKNIAKIFRTKPHFTEWVDTKASSQ